jgi:hypothetical protein
MKIELNSAEIEIILEWIEFSLQRSTRYGGPEILFPTDLVLVNKLKKSDGSCDLSADEIASIADVMESSVSSRYGANKYLFGLEKALYDKILFLHTYLE